MIVRNSGFTIQIERYEGPLDLLLDLIRKHKLDIFDIPIAQITDQYLDYVRRADELNVDLGGEFVFHGGDADSDQVEDAAAEETRPSPRRSRKIHAKN